MSLEQNTTAGQNDRRSFLKLLAAAPLLATIGSRSLANTVVAATKKSVTRKYLLAAWRQIFY